MWLLLTMKADNKDIKSKRNFPDNHVHNILRLLDGRVNFPFTTSETKRVY